MHGVMETIKADGHLKRTRGWGEQQHCHLAVITKDSEKQKQYGDKQKAEGQRGASFCDSFITYAIVIL